jgi:lysophospholipase L1-like esterase
VSAALTGGSPDVAVVLIGANDATHVTSPGDVGADVGAAVRRLAAADVSVVVGTCPDMGAARALPRPVRDLVAWHGRAIARTSARAATEGGAVVVDLAGLTGPAFRADPATLSVDRFHPSDLGYGLWSAALEPAVVAGATGG